MNGDEIGFSASMGAFGGCNLIPLKMTRHLVANKRRSIGEHGLSPSWAKRPFSLRSCDPFRQLASNWLVVLASHRYATSHQPASKLMAGGPWSGKIVTYAACPWQLLQVLALRLDEKRNGPLRLRYPVDSCFESTNQPTHRSADGHGWNTCDEASMSSSKLARRTKEYAASLKFLDKDGTRNCLGPRWSRN